MRLIAQIKTTLLIIRAMPLAIQLVFGGSFFNIVIFGIKILFFGPKTYTVIQFLFASVVFSFLLFYYTPRFIKRPKRSLTEVLTRTHKYLIIRAGRRYIMPLIGLMGFCFPFVLSRLTWVIMAWSGLHFIGLSLFAVSTWTCSMYIKISGFLAILIFFTSFYALFQQHKYTPFLSGIKDTSSKSSKIATTIEDGELEDKISFFSRNTPTVASPVKAILPKQTIGGRLYVVIISTLIRFTRKIAYANLFVMSSASAIILQTWDCTIPLRITFAVNFIVWVFTFWLSKKHSTPSNWVTKLLRLIISANIVVMSSASAIILQTWDCTIPLRITFAVSFFIWVLTVWTLRSYERKIFLSTPNHPIRPNITTQTKICSISHTRYIDMYEADIVIGNKTTVRKRPGFIPVDYTFWTYHFNTEVQVINIPETFQNPYHVVSNSPWPFYTALSVFNFVTTIVNFFHNSTSRFFIIFALMVLISVLFVWFSDVNQESDLGEHTRIIRWNLAHAFLLFIVSEIMLFFSIFWCYFHHSLVPALTIYCSWPPVGIEALNPFSLPFFNTSILLSSGVILNYGHVGLSLAKFWVVDSTLLFTLGLGCIFTLIQFFEYIHAPFNITDSVFGSIFYFATGFHGLHVLLGSILLYHALLRNIARRFTVDQHLAFVTSAWYWHFVDIVWIFLFFCIYWWGGKL